MAVNFAPLEILNGMEDLYDGDVYDTVDDIVKARGVNLHNITMPEYFDAILSLGSPEAPEKDDLKRLQAVCLEVAGRIMHPGNQVLSQKLFGLDSSRMDKLDIVTEVKDIFLQHMLIREWSFNKQVFKPDEDFAKCLILTDNLFYTKDMIEHLPVRSFYIDLSACPYFYPIVGMFADIRFGLANQNHCYITLNGVSDNLEKDNPAKTLTGIPGSYDKYMLYSYYTEGIMDDENGLEIDVSYVKNMQHDFYSPLYSEKSQKEVKDASKSMQAAYALALQMIAYLSVEKPDLDEDPVTKQTYRKRDGKPKNKFSEIQAWNLGYRYGADFRKKLKTYAVSDGENNKTDDNSPHRKRKSPMPHFRCAHWHRHRCGKGRKETRLVWHEPIFVKGQLNMTEKPAEAVIHRVRSHEKQS